MIKLQIRLLLPYCNITFCSKIIFTTVYFNLIAQRKISVLATPVTSSNVRNQALLLTELRLLQGTIKKLVRSFLKKHLTFSFTFTKMHKLKQVHG